MDNRTPEEKNEDGVAVFYVILVSVIIVIASCICYNEGYYRGAIHGACVSLTIEGSSSKEIYCGTDPHRNDRP